MIEAIIVGLGLVLFVLILYFAYKDTQIDSYKEGDYVVWLGSLYEVIVVAKDILVIKHSKLHTKYIVDLPRRSIKKVPKKLAEKYLE